MTRASVPDARQLRRILVVDDHAEWRPLLLMLLDGEGYEVVITESGENALNIAPSWMPDLILLGLGQWKTKAVEVSSRLRYAMKRHVPIVLMSTDLPVDRSISPDEHFDDYIHKGELIHVLVDCVERHLPGSEAYKRDI